MRARDRFQRFLATTAVLVLAGTVLSPSQAQRPTCLGERATIVGTEGSERLVGTSGRDVIVAKGGADYVLGKASRDLICAQNGRDHVDAGAGRDEIKGGAGDDSIVGGWRTVSLEGGKGDDIFFTRGGKGGVIRGGPGSDWVTFVDRGCSRRAKVRLAAHDARYRNCAGTKTFVWTIRGIENVEGGPGPDVLVGSSGHERLLGQDRRDTLKGRAGNDLLHGGAAYDSGRGGNGRDVCMSVEAQRSC